MADGETAESPQTGLEGPLKPDQVLKPVRPLEVDGESQTASGDEQSEHVQAEIADKLRRGIPLSSAEKQKMAVTLRMSGANYRRIGLVLGVNHVTAKRYCDAAFEQHATDSVEQLRMIQFARLEHMIMLLWPNVATRDIASMHTVRALMNDENNLMGVGVGESAVARIEGRTLIATGDKEEYIQALKEAREAQERESSASTEEEADVEATDSDSPPAIG